MTLSLYAQYAAITSLFVLVVVIIALSIWSWSERRNTRYAIQANQVAVEKMFDPIEDDFEGHVESAIGMRPDPNLN